MMVPRLATAALVLILASAPAWSHELTTFITVGGEHSSNMDRAPGGRSDQMALAELAVDYELDFPTVDMTLNYAATKRNFDHGTFPSDERLLGSADGTWLITPDNLTLTFSNDRDELRLDSLGPDTPDNVVTRNTLRIGPQYIMRLSEANSLMFVTNLVRNEFDRRGPIESDTTVLTAAWLRAFSRVSAVRVTVQHVDSDYRRLPFDSQTKRLSFALNTQTRRVGFSLEGGKDVIDRGGRQGIDGFFVSLTASYQARSSAFRFEALKQLTDSAIGLSIGGGSGLDDGSDIGPDLPSGDRNFHCWRRSRTHPCGADNGSGDRESSVQLVVLDGLRSTGLRDRARR